VKDRALEFHIRLQQDWGPRNSQDFPFRQSTIGTQKVQTEIVVGRYWYAIDLEEKDRDAEKKSSGIWLHQNGGCKKVGTMESRKTGSEVKPAARNFSLIPFKRKRTRHVEQPSNTNLRSSYITDTQERLYDTIRVNMHVGTEHDQIVAATMEIMLIRIKRHRMSSEREREETWRFAPVGEDQADAEAA
jgi:hypothetical protein